MSIFDFYLLSFNCAFRVFFLVGRGNSVLPSTVSKLLQQTVTGLSLDQTRGHSPWKVESLSITICANVRDDGKVSACNVIMWQDTCRMMEEWSGWPSWFSLLCLSSFCFRTETSDQRKWKVQTNPNPNPYSISSAYFLTPVFPSKNLPTWLWQIDINNRRKIKYCNKQEIWKRLFWLCLLKISAAVGFFPVQRSCRRSNVGIII